MGDYEPRPDRDLLRRFSGGDREAFTTLYRAHFPAVFRFVLYMTGDRIQAGEITQDVFVWLVHHPSGFDPDRGELPAFLGGVARKLLHRRQQAERRWLPLDEAALAPAEDAGSEFTRGLEKRQDVAELRKAIAALPERYREAVVLCDLQEKRAGAGTFRVPRRSPRKMSGPGSAFIESKRFARASAHFERTNRRHPTETIESAAN